MFGTPRGLRALGTGQPENVIAPYETRVRALTPSPRLPARSPGRPGYPDFVCTAAPPPRPPPAHRGPPSSPLILGKSPLAYSEQPPSVVGSTPRFFQAAPPHHQQRRRNNLGLVVATSPLLEPPQVGVQQRFKRRNKGSPHAGSPQEATPANFSFISILISSAATRPPSGPLARSHWILDPITSGDGPSPRHGPRGRSHWKVGLTSRGCAHVWARLWHPSQEEDR